MPRIGQKEIEAVYALSKEIAQGKTTELQAAQILHDSMGMNFSSAWGYLRKRKQMLAGERYTRTMNIGATRYFLESIYKDEGPEGLRAAISSVRKHVLYYSEQGKSGLPSISVLADQMEKPVRPTEVHEFNATWNEEI